MNARWRCPRRSHEPLATRKPLSFDGACGVGVAGLCSVLAYFACLYLIMSWPMHDPVAMLEVQSDIAHAERSRDARIRCLEGAALPVVVELRASSIRFVDEAHRRAIVLEPVAEAGSAGRGPGAPELARLRAELVAAQDERRSRGAIFVVDDGITLDQMVRAVDVAVGAGYRSPAVRALATPPVSE